MLNSPNLDVISLFVEDAIFTDCPKSCHRKLDKDFSEKAAIVLAFRKLILLRHWIEFRAYQSFKILGVSPIESNKDYL